MKRTRLLLSVLALVCFVTGCEKSLNLGEETFVCNKDEDCGEGYACAQAAGETGLKVCVAKEGGGETTTDEGGAEGDEGSAEPTDEGETGDPGTGGDDVEPEQDEGEPDECEGKELCEQEGGIKCAEGAERTCTKEADSECLAWSEPASCNDGNACTEDSCADGEGCKHEDVAAEEGDCTDGDPCTENDECSEGSCVGTAVVCDDENPCTEDSCDEQTGACKYESLSDGTDCSGDDPCIETAECSDGTCDVTMIDCEETPKANPCTIDSCVEGSGGEAKCIHVNVQDAQEKACNDGERCTVEDVCVGGVCQGMPKDCDDGDQCTEDSCSPSSGDCVNNKTAMNGEDCVDGDPCTEEDECSEGVCAGATKDCDDGDPCTVDSCNQDGDCENVAGNDGDDCDDEDACTEHDKCSGGSCEGQAKVCDDSDPCTVDSCGANGDCVFAAGNDGDDCEDGDKCTIDDKCESGGCKAGEEANCDDGEHCTADSCDPQTGFCDNNAAAMLNKPCEDGDLCTENDHCKQGKCRPGPALDCDDGNPCSYDFCSKESGCVNEQTGMEGRPCEHESLCALDPRCKEGDCIAHGFRMCNDNDSCTIDSCDDQTGRCVVDVPSQKLGDGCNDENECTAGDVCTPNGCQGTFEPSLPACGGGADCDSAIALPSLVPTSVQGSTIGLSDYFEAAECPRGTDDGGGIAPDLVYSYVAPKDGAYSFDLEANFGAYLYISPECPLVAELCMRQAGSEVIEVSMAAGDKAFLVVDGTAPGNEGHYTIKVTSRPEEMNCLDGKDNDQDGKVDCEDQDCSFRPECSSGDGNTCEEAVLLPQQLPSATRIAFGGGKGSDEWNPSMCDQSLPGGFEREDRVARFFAPHAGYYRFAVDPDGTDFNTQLYISLACPPERATCLGYDNEELGHGGEVLVVELVADQAANVFIDGFRSGVTGTAKGEALLRVEEVEVACFNDRDDDGDGKRDCMDPDCSERPVCQAPKTPEPGDLLIIEVMGNPLGVSDAKGEWIEVVNVSEWRLDLQGFYIGYANATGDQVEPDVWTPVNEDLILPPLRPAVFGQINDPAANGGLELDGVWSRFTINNNRDSTLFLISPLWDEVTPVPYDMLLDRVGFDWGLFERKAIGRSWQLGAIDEVYDGWNREPGYNDNPMNWCITPATDVNMYGEQGKYGTPRMPPLECSITSDVPIPVAYDQVQPIFRAKCANCHTTQGRGGHNIGADYGDAHAGTTSCGGAKLYDCVLERVKEGDMPPGKSCDGDPLVDAARGRTGCLTEDELDLLSIWSNLGAPEHTGSDGNF